MTLAELLLVYVLLGVVLWLVAGLGDYVQREFKRELSEARVLTLREALQVYHSEVGQYPPADPQGTARPAIAGMLGQPASAAMLSNWPGAPAPTGDRRASDFVDAWGRPFRYRTLNTGSAEERERIRADGGIPIFESAGPDGQFGDRHPRFAEDNLASDLASILQARQ